MKLTNRNIFDDGTVICEDFAVIEALYADKNIDIITAEPSYDIELYNKSDQFLDTHFGEIKTATEPQYLNVNWFEYWTTPEPYALMDIETYIFDRCKTEKEVARVQEELVLFEERHMYPVLKHLVYLTDHWRTNNILWGVGRGSSVGSFVLYLIGINRINPLEFDLGIEEFLK